MNYLLLPLTSDLSPLTSPLAATLWARFWSVPCYRYGLSAGIALALVCGLLSVFVVSRRMAFIGEGISHSAFGGAGLWYLLALVLPFMRGDLVRDLVVGLFCIATAVIIGRMAWRGHVSEDSAIGIALVAGMALGVLFVDLRSGLYAAMRARGAVPEGVVARVPFEDLLFGNIVYVTATDLWWAGGLAAVVLLAAALFFKELIFFAFDSEGATVFGVPAQAIHYSLLVVLAATIMIAMRMLGVILASAFLVLPGTIAFRWSHRMWPVVAISMAAAAASVFVGLFLSILTNFTVGPVVVMTLCAFLAASHLINRLRQRARRAA